ncbi:hypothetical protein LZ30DRAFT_785324 [Colletotrichum cereale]|nr:hypothetical protein LZ30DRAFT_785324 [Colletotrichum cereale]
MNANTLMIHDTKSELTAASYVQGLDESVAELVEAQETSPLSVCGAHKRWEYEYYAQKFRHVIKASFSYAPSDGSNTPKRPTDSDAVLIRDWALGCLIDGGLSLANYFAQDDDAICCESRNCINTYLGKE